MPDDDIERVLPLIYDELHVLSGRMHAERGLSVHATSVVHEAFLKLTRSERLTWTDRAHFLAIAAKAMRHVLADRAKHRGRQKRGGDWERVDLEQVSVGPQTVDLVVLNDLLTQLRDLDDASADVAEMRLLAGMTHAEIAKVAGRSVRAVERDWRTARAWLVVRLEES